MRGSFIASRRFDERIVDVFIEELDLLIDPFLVARISSAAKVAPKEPLMRHLPAAVAVFLVAIPTLARVERAWAEPGNVELQKRDNAIEIKIDGKEYLIMTEDDILAVID
jgi:hypothetical protein